MFRSTTRVFSSVILFLSLTMIFGHCSEKFELPPADPDNGKLFLPENFQAVVVVDSLKGRARHLAVNSNGDIYVKSRFSEKDGRNVALRDTNNDGKADVIESFGSYEKERSYGTAMRIHDGYLYFSSELSVYRQKLIPGELIPNKEIEEIVVDDHAHGMHEHIAKPICFDNKGNLYVPFGAASADG